MYLVAVHHLNTYLFLNSIEVGWLLSELALESLYKFLSSPSVCVPEYRTS